MPASAVADVVPLQGNPFDSAAASTVAEQWLSGTEEPDPVSELLPGGSVDVEMQAPLLELLGLPTQRARRGNAPAYGVSGQAEPHSSAARPDAGRLPAPPGLEDSDEGVVGLGRKALERFASPGASAGAADPYGAEHAARLPQPPAARSTSAQEERSSWLRDIMQFLRGNREWVVLALVALLGATIAIRHFGQQGGGVKPRGGSQSSTPRGPRLAR